MRSGGERGSDVVATLPDGALLLRCGAVVSGCDLPRVREISGWYTPTSGGWKGYAVATFWQNGRKRTVGMHRWIMGEPPGLVDHKDGNPLNDRRDNLRLANKAQNGHNQKGKPGRFKGVFRTSGGSKLPWRAQLAKTIDGKLRSFPLGTFATRLEAALAYDAGARKMYGEFAAPNFPPEIAARLAAVPELARCSSVVEMSRGAPMWVLRHADGSEYLTRWVLWGCDCLENHDRNVMHSCFLHYIHTADGDNHMHNHGWSFSNSLILSGGYTERRSIGTHAGRMLTHSAGDIVNIPVDEYHSVVSVEPNTYTMFICGQETSDWGFLVDGKHVPHKEYFRRQDAQKMTHRRER